MYLISLIFYVHNINLVVKSGKIYGQYIEIWMERKWAEKVTYKGRLPGRDVIGVNP